MFFLLNPPKSTTRKLVGLDGNKTGISKKSNTSIILKGR